MQGTHRWFATMGSAIALAIFAGCAVDEDDVPSETKADDVDEPVGKTEQDFTASGYQSLTYTNATGTAYLGVTSGTTPFLIGFGGNLANGGTATVVRWSPNTHLLVTAGAGATFYGSAGIVYPASPTLEKFYTNDTTSGPGAPAVELASTNGNVRCFLTSFSNSPAPRHYFASTSDYLQIFKSGVAPNEKWYLGGVGRVNGGASCAAVTSTVWGFDVSTAGTYDLGPDTPGKTCWLTGAGGSFRNNSTADRIQIYFDPGILRWQLEISSGKHAAGECNI